MTHFFRELVGTWELLEEELGPGGSSLVPIISVPTEVYFTPARKRQSISIELKKDGEVDIKSGFLDNYKGLQWKFKPGPAHLDTCEFYVALGSDTDATTDLLLKYVGFIDRGQRIESRY